MSFRECHRSPTRHLAFEGYQYAKEKGKGNEYNDRMLQAFFQEEQDIGDIDILTQLAGEIGLDEKEYREALETRKYKEAHQQALQHSYKKAGYHSSTYFCNWGNESYRHSFQRNAGTNY